VRIVTEHNNPFPSTVSAYQGKQVTFYAQDDNNNPISVLWSLTYRLDGNSLCPTLGGDSDGGTLSTDIPYAGPPAPFYNTPGTGFSTTWTPPITPMRGLLSASFAGQTRSIFLNVA
jgi:hypothetical protein